MKEEKMRRTNHTKRKPSPISCLIRLQDIPVMILLPNLVENDSRDGNSNSCTELGIQNDA
jgi:hypothetical protein